MVHDCIYKLTNETKLTGAAQADQHDRGGRNLEPPVPDSRAGDRQGRDAERGPPAAA